MEINGTVFFLGFAKGFATSFSAKHGRFSMPFMARDIESATLALLGDHSS